ncbi:hypothetical protein BC940DRAFT_309738, partial [Gongronella butleri]
ADGWAMRVGHLARTSIFFMCVCAGSDGLHWRVAFFVLVPAAAAPAYSITRAADNGKRHGFARAFQFCVHFAAFAVSRTCI